MRLWPGRSRLSLLGRRPGDRRVECPEAGEEAEAPPGAVVREPDQPRRQPDPPKREQADVEDAQPPWRKTVPQWVEMGHGIKGGGRDYAGRKEQRVREPPTGQQKKCRRGRADRDGRPIVGAEH